MENFNITNIPKGQKVVIRQRPNGNTEIMLRPDLENGQMVFGELSGILLAVAFGLLLFLGASIFSSDKQFSEGQDQQEQVDANNLDTYVYGE